MSGDDGLSPFADLVDDSAEPAPGGSGRAGRIVLWSILGVILLVLGGGGGYVWWASEAPVGPPTVTSYAPSVPAGAAAAVKLPSTGEMLVSVEGGDGYLDAATTASWASGGDDARPMASVTKLITALVVLDAHPLNGAEDPGPTISFTKADTDLYDQYYVRGATIARMPDGAKLSLHDALATMLLPSASNYATAVARWGFGSEGAFVDAARAWLNAKGLTSTRVVDATGLDDRSVSTPSDLVALGKIAAANPAIARIASTTSISLPGGPGTVTNTNDLLGTDGVTGLKTGNLGDGTFNLLFTADLNVGIGKLLHITGVRLGGATHDSTDDDVSSFLRSVHDGFHQISVGTSGAEVGAITTPWGASAKVVVAKNASLMTWSDTPVTVALDSKTPEKYADGEVVGTITWTAGSQTASSDITIAGAIEQPTLLWRLTHPGELGSLW